MTEKLHATYHYYIGVSSKASTPRTDALRHNALLLRDTLGASPAAALEALKQPAAQALILGARIANEQSKEKLAAGLSPFDLLITTAAVNALALDSGRQLRFEKNVFPPRTEQQKAHEALLETFDEQRQTLLRSPDQLDGQVITMRRTFIGALGSVCAAMEIQQKISWENHLGNNRDYANALVTGSLYQVSV